LLETVKQTKKLEIHLNFTQLFISKAPELTFSQLI